MLGWIASGVYDKRRTPHGVRGLKFTPFRHSQPPSGGRTPHGVRGLKCNYNKKGVQATKEDVALRMGRGLK